MKRLLCSLIVLYLLPVVLVTSEAEAGKIWNRPADCLGTFLPWEMCRTNYDPEVHDAMFIRDIKQLGPHAPAVLPAVVYAEDEWNTLGAGPQVFSLDANINDSYNYIKVVSLQQIADEFNTVALAVSRLCPGNGACVHRLNSPPVNTLYGEIWLADTSEPSYCFVCLDTDSRNWGMTHEFGHVLGLDHLGNCADPGATLMCDATLGLPSGLPKRGAVEAGTTERCVTGTNPNDDGIRCIYNWYNCSGGSDCDGVSGSADNCPTMPNQTQRNYDGEILDLASEAKEHYLVDALLRSTRYSE